MVNSFFLFGRGCLLGCFGLGLVLVICWGWVFCWGLVLLIGLVVLVVFFGGGVFLTVLGILVVWVFCDDGVGFGFCGGGLLLWDLFFGLFFVCFFFVGGVGL